MIVNDPRALPRIIDLVVPGDAGVSQRTPGLCFGDRHDLLLLGLSLLCGEQGRLGGGACQLPPFRLCGARMIAGVGPCVDLVDQETARAPTCQPPTLRNLASPSTRAGSTSGTGLGRRSGPSAGIRSGAPRYVSGFCPRRPPSPGDRASSGTSKSDGDFVHAVAPDGGGRDRAVHRELECGNLHPLPRRPCAGTRPPPLRVNTERRIREATLSAASSSAAAVMGLLVTSIPVR